MEATTASNAASLGFTLVWMVLLFALMYFIMIRPQRKEQKRHAAMLNAMEVGESFDCTVEDASGVGIKALDDYTLEMLGQKFTVDKFQLNWINRTIFLYGSWPAKSSFEKVGDQWYFTFKEPYQCRQVQLCLNVIPDNEYIFFEHRFKRSQEPSSTDEDEDDDGDDFTDEQETVVDSLGNKLKDYFTFTFEDGLGARQRDSLARVLDKLTKQTADSTKWKLDYKSNF